MQHVSFLLYIYIYNISSFFSSAYHSDLLSRSYRVQAGAGKSKCPPSSPHIPHFLSAGVLARCEAKPGLGQTCIKLRIGGCEPSSAM